MRTESCLVRRSSRAGSPAWALPLALGIGLQVLIGSVPAAEPAPDFRRDVLPILADHCFACHGPDATTRKANLRLDQREGALRSKDPVILPGHAADSVLLERLLSKDPEDQMPPPGKGKPVNPAQVQIIQRWIDAGAPWSEHWAFTPIRPVAPPSVHDKAWIRNPIDQFVLSRLEADGLKGAPEADRTTLARRLALDLIGLPPKPSDVDRFVHDSRPDALERLVNQLLASPHYGERMAIDWLDMARFADTNGYQNDFARTMWPWRDWVIAAFNRNQPVDQFIVDQLAGDLLPNATLEQKIATGFNRNSRTITEAGSIDEEWRIENAIDRVETATTIFLGLTMGCAQLS
ncbi:MAG: DUF1549 domain-containing protein [Isosphaeraceae bacterium]